MAAFRKGNECRVWNIAAQVFSSCCREKFLVFPEAQQCRHIDVLEGAPVISGRLVK